MDIKVLRQTARERLKGFCKVCPVCNGKACAGEVPGMGGVGTGGGFTVNIEALARHRFNMRTVHDVRTADTTVALWGQQLSMPVLAAPMTGTPYNMGGQLSEEEFVEALVSGSVMAGTLAMTGDGADPSMFDSGLKAISGSEGRGIAIIKPRQQAEVVKRIRRAEDSGVVGVGVDVDGAGLVTMALKDQPVSPKTIEELKELAGSTEKPFIVKGVMTPDEAEKAVSAGAAAIVVSNHGGRVLDHTPGAADVLPAIARAVKGSVTVLADGGVRTGADVLKLLALGAEAVLVGRPLVVGAFGGGAEGVAYLLNRMRNELVQAMLLTGTSDVRTVKREILYNDEGGD
jgi:isopentenyl diphosphate isomerase/L-lactate dehydrogenase-like FMN-dependent dehydrogenase